MFFAPTYYSSSQMGQRNTSLPFFLRYFLPTLRRASKIFSLSVDSIFPLSNFYHCSTLSLFIFFCNFYLNCFYSYESIQYLFLRFSFSIFFFSLLLFLYSLIYSIFSGFYIFQLFYSIFYSVYESLFKSSSIYFSYTASSGSSFSTQFFLVTERLIARIPQGGSVIIASKNYSAFRPSLVESILKMLGIGRPYCQKFKFILGVKTYNFLSA